ncbi:hypothetical protein DL96DRAFT_1560295 [Flagelloscypha sp. PMI_526]|nr:hypothetical protein DL96DRAFT_1560295 [Flagelloscypha sp. PMI_526]
MSLGPALIQLTARFPDTTFLNVPKLNSVIPGKTAPVFDVGRLASFYGKREEDTGIELSDLLADLLDLPSKPSEPSEPSGPSESSDVSIEVEPTEEQPNADNQKTGLIHTESFGKFDMDDYFAAYKRTSIAELD